ncbi:D-alanyl-D-alanine carboxypeptidase [Leptolyngbya sp. UWPOB_LEPTO1]|uniref:D-alanyl-D-alanine carboxypeptidase n=1 Tax=Leptolyngbya sp. UWPOB_LEPTO1 TaxID=2815653 RepID=UPI0025810F95|nr:D-alanyl-D-alanine carboxypeptidase [Leptolyngbya sp. UWPOB_LEPTO1]
MTSCTAPKTADSPTASPNPTPEEARRTLTFPPAPPTAPLSVSPTSPVDPNTSAIVQKYLSQISAQGYPQTVQGIWMQSGNTLLAQNQGTIPLSAASLTKVATSLAALQTFGIDHRFETVIGTNGTIKDGVLNGDLILQGNGNPLFVWEEAIAVANALSQLGIKKVTGNLIVSGRFFMNFNPELNTSGELFKQALNANTWTGEVAEQYATLPAGTPKPQIAIAGNVKVATNPSIAQTLIRHRSLPLPELLKKMNRYSNNAMAEMVALAVGGAKVVALKSAQAAGVPQQEVILVNGSGLSPENRISPRAVCAMFLAIEQYLKPSQMTVGDIFAIVGEDAGILDQRKLPKGLVTKSGSLNEVSALAGALPTSQKGVVWFVVMNGGGANLEGFRAGQESLVNTFANQWGAVSAVPAQLAANRDRASLKSLIEKAN